MVATIHGIANVIRLVGGYRLCVAVDLRVCSSSRSVSCYALTLLIILFSCENRGRREKQERKQEKKKRRRKKKKKRNTYGRRRCTQPDARLLTDEKLNKYTALEEKKQTSKHYWLVLGSKHTIERVAVYRLQLYSRCVVY